MEQLLTVASVMVAMDKSDVKTLNKYLKDYNDLIFGKLKLSKNQKQDKNTLFEHLDGFRTIFGKEQVTFKPKVGKKLEREVSGISLQDLIKLEKK